MDSGNSGILKVLLLTITHPLVDGCLRQYIRKIVIYKCHCHIYAMRDEVYFTSKTKHFSKHFHN